MKAWENGFNILRQYTPGASRQIGWFEKSQGSPKRSKASSSGGGSSWSHFSLFHRHSQKQWMLKNAQAKDLSQRKKTLSIRSSKKCFTDKVKRETVDSFLLYPRNLTSAKKDAVSSCRATRHREAGPIWITISTELCRRLRWNKNAFASPMDLWSGQKFHNRDLGRKIFFNWLGLYEI